MMKKYRAKIHMPFVKKGTVYRMLDGNTWAPENGKGLTFHCDFYDPALHPEVFEEIFELTSLEKWRMILRYRNEPNFVHTLNEGQIENMATFLDHYEYDPDFVWIKHKDKILEKEKEL